MTHKNVNKTHSPSVQSINMACDFTHSHILDKTSSFENYPVATGKKPSSSTLPGQITALNVRTLRAKSNSKNRSHAVVDQLGRMVAWQLYCPGLICFWLPQWPTLTPDCHSGMAPCQPRSKLLWCMYDLASCQCFITARWLTSGCLHCISLPIATQVFLLE